MHFITFVVTKEKPTEAVLAAAMAPFGPNVLGKDAKWDEWTLGGRYTGLLIPHSIENTVTGGPNVSDAELAIAAMAESADTVVTQPGRTGPGVDALQARNMKRFHNKDNGAFPYAILLDGHWHSDEVIGVEGMARQMATILGIDFDHLAGKFAGQHDFTEERAALNAWREKAVQILDTVRPDDWLSVVDIHN
jgi:hypothetical protein